MPEHDTIRLLIADDHKLVLDGLVSILKDEKEFVIVATAINGAQVLELTDKLEYDVCLLDISMPQPDGIETARILRTIRPDINIIILTTYSDKEIITGLLQIGIKGYLLKNSTKQELVEAIKKVAGGGFYFTDQVNDVIMKEYARKKPNENETTDTVVLTQREKEILELLSKEYTNGKIAAALHISYRTVETHRKNIMQKTKASNLAGLIRFAYSKGIIK